MESNRVYAYAYVYIYVCVLKHHPQLDCLKQASLLGVESATVNHQVRVGHAAEGDEHGDPQAQVRDGDDDKALPHVGNRLSGAMASRAHGSEHIRDELALENTFKLRDDGVERGEVRQIGGADTSQPIVDAQVFADQVVVFDGTVKGVIGVATSRRAARAVQSVPRRVDVGDARKFTVGVRLADIVGVVVRPVRGEERTSGRRGR